MSSFINKFWGSSSSATSTGATSTSANTSSNTPAASRDVLADSLQTCKCRVLFQKFIIY